jgi:CubicO group peptidase (beta-lactamase class C family)
MRLLKLFTAITCFLTANSYAAGDVDQSKIRETVDNAIRPVMQTFNIPGMAIAVTISGKKHFYNYGVASRETKHPITSETLFEIGSISKTFTATLAAYAQVNGKLSLSDSPSKYFPSLHGSSFDKVTLLDLGTHTSGGLPLQVPDNIKNTDHLIDYFKAWQPTYPAGTHRTYSNLSIGMLGMIAAKSMQGSFDDAIEKKLFHELGMMNSYINVPTGQMKDYAQGYTKKDAPVRMSPGVLASEAYAVKSCTVDMIGFIEANMQVTKLDGKLQRAIADTHKGYFKSGEMIQGLIWEQYPFPVELKQVLAGNSDTMTYQATIATRLSPPLPPQPDVLINKTGSTNGFAAYVAFIPAQKLGIVILANKNYPIDARVTAAYQILTALDSRTASKTER